MVRGKTDVVRSDNYMFPFERLEVWQESIGLATFLLELLERVPMNRHLRIAAHMEGAVTSIAQNIAEGKGLSA